MKKFVVERILPGAGNLSPEELQHVSQASCAVVTKLGVPYYWVESFITEDKIYCIHIAESEDMVRQHAKLAKWPINTIVEVKATIDPLNSNPL